MRITANPFGYAHICLHIFTVGFIVALIYITINMQHCDSDIEAILQYYRVRYPVLAMLLLICFCITIWTQCITFPNVALIIDSDGMVFAILTMFPAIPYVSNHLVSLFALWWSKNVLPAVSFCTSHISDSALCSVGIVFPMPDICLYLANVCSHSSPFPLLLCFHELHCPRTGILALSC